MWYDAARTLTLLLDFANLSGTVKVTALSQTGQASAGNMHSYDVHVAHMCGSTPVDNLFGKYTNPMDATGTSLLCNAYWNVCRMLNKTHPLIHSGVWGTGSLLLIGVRPLFWGGLLAKTFEAEIMCPELGLVAVNKPWPTKTPLPCQYLLLCQETQASWDILQQAAGAKFPTKNVKVGTWKLWKSRTIFRFPWYLFWGGIQGYWIYETTQWTNIEKIPTKSNPYAPIPSASGFGGGFRCLNTFSQGFWSTRKESNCLTFTTFNSQLLVKVFTNNWVISLPKFLIPRINN